jgi:hypothetical protein
MSVQFEEGDIYKNQISQSEQTGLVTKLFIKIGLVKEQGSSNVPMIIVAVICFALAIFFFTR